LSRRARTGSSLATERHPRGSRASCQLARHDWQPATAQPTWSGPRGRISERLTLRRKAHRQAPTEGSVFVSKGCSLRELPAPVHPSAEAARRREAFAG
jgi:hypothetical protein